MHVSVTDAKAQLTDLVRRAEAGDEIVLTRHGRAAVRLVPVEHVRDPPSRRALIQDVRHTASPRVMTGANAARCQDDLYGDDGLLQ